MVKMKWFHRRRLERLADKLVGEGAYAKVGPVPAHKFDMLYIAQNKRGGWGIVFTAFDPLKCNTAACALGWAESDPWFRKRSIDSPSVYEMWGISSMTYSHLFFANSYKSYGSRMVSPRVVANRLRKVARA